MMEQEKLHDDDGFGDSMVSSSSPYQPTTEPVAHRRPFIGGTIVDLRYIKSLQGVLSIAEILFDVIIAVCVGSVGFCGAGCGALSFVQAVCITATVTTATIAIVWAFSLETRLTFVNWELTEVVNSSVVALCYFIASCVLAANSLGNAATAAVVFGFLCTLLYAASFWVSFGRFRVKRQKQNSGISHIKGVSEEGGLVV